MIGIENQISRLIGQITELATEVLNDATEEGQVSVSSELQVEKKKCAEAERQFLAEKAKNEALEKRVKELEEQLFNTNEENDAIKEKFTGIVSDREQQIQRLNWEIERLRYSEDGEFKNVHLGSPPKTGPFSTNAEVEKNMTKLKEKHECEMAAIISANASNIQQIRAEYEERIRELELWSSVAAKKCAATEKSSDEKQTEEIAQLRREIAELQTSVEQLDGLREEKEKLIGEKTAHLEEIRQLKALNVELMTSYNETTAKLDELKNNGGDSQVDTILDLSNKIASLKSMLNETESRYELCKMEQTETANRLELLLKEFADLRSSMHAAQANAEGNERDLMGEMHSLRDTLEHTKADREKLVNDFRESVRAVSGELAELKAYNQRLVNENSQLHDSLEQLNELRNALNASEDKLSNLRKKFAETEDEFTREIERVTAERDELRNVKEILSNLQTQRKKADERQSQTDDEPKQRMTEQQIAEMVEQNVQLKTELNEREEELYRLRNDKVLAEITTSEGHSKRPPSDTDSATSNNDWERMGKEEIEVEGVSSSAGSEEKETHMANKRKKSSELSDSSTQTDETQFGEDKSEERLNLLEEDLAKANSKCEGMATELANANLRIGEAFKIKEQLEAEICSKNSMIDKAEETLRRREKEIALDRERMAKLEGDLQRLREHLLIMEEHSSKDAIAAEERETELRRQIRVLREKSTTEGTSMVNSLEQYQLKVSELQEKVEHFESEKIQMEAKLTGKDKTLAEMNKTLADLQSVLRELAEDQKMERQKSDTELSSVREELKQKRHILKEIEEAKTNLEDALAKITRELNLSNEQLVRKENLVEELENQLEEMRIAGTGKHQYTITTDQTVVGGINGSGAVSSHKIDDATLRQLFLSYFTAEKSKQPEIAIVMSRILGYSAEEQSQISAALSKSSSSASSWFAPFSSTPSASPGPPGGLSLTEQFVRFLEQESMANARALLQPPIQSLPADSATFLVGESPPVPTHNSSSNADLKSILEQ
ncbi:hypothetical protein niasHS_000497 [Heterodera schachtii]|uniref:GRIP domain-containing protein n=1 Tax=Heterodera schachtii TaxID=97005 RepID=A0ABD2K4E0_HETSC